jgi:REP element-mobilizing transposase RayT
MFYRRRLPHWIPEDSIVFVTWGLAGSPAPHMPFQTRTPAQPPGSGPHWLKDPEIASIVAEAIQYGETRRQFYELYAWVITSNHVHLILQPDVAFPTITRWLKGRTSRIANRMLGRTGAPFWQDESFDHWIRSTDELLGLIDYVESNPVKAGLVQTPSEWPWSSARFRVPAQI